MHYMLYNYRCSRLIEAELRYREFYRKTHANADNTQTDSQHYQLNYRKLKTLTKLLPSLETLEKEFDQAMDPTLNTAKFWKDFKYNSESTDQNLSTYMQQSFLSERSLSRLRGMYRHKESTKNVAEKDDRSSKPYTDSKEEAEMKKWYPVVLRASALLDLPLLYMLQIFKYEDYLDDNIINREFLNPKTDYIWKENIGKKVFFWKDALSDDTKKDFKKKNGIENADNKEIDTLTSDPWMEQYIRLIRRPALLHRKAMQASKGYLPYEEVAPEKFMEAEMYGNILLNPVLYKIHGMLYEMKLQEHTPLYLELYRTFLSMKPDDAFYLSYLTCHSYDGSDEGFEFFEEIKKNLLKYATIRKPGDERFLALLNLATRASVPTKEHSEQELPETLYELHFVSDIRNIFATISITDYDERELKESIFSNNQFIPFSSLFGEDSECQALTPDIEKMNIAQLESHVLSCLEAAYWLVSVHAVTERFEELMTLFSLYLFLTDAQKNHLTIKLDKTLYQCFIPDDLKKEAAEYFSIKEVKDKL